MIKRAAVFGFNDQCRFVLERGEGATCAWLACNPSRASHLVDDPTAKRFVHHGGRAGCTRQLVGNLWAWIATHQADLWAALGDGRYTREMHLANLDALAMIGAQAQVHIAAFGAAGRGRPDHVEEALDAFSCGGQHPVYCLGSTSDDMPLHPLARGRHAVRNDAVLRRWRG